MDQHVVKERTYVSNESNINPNNYFHYMTFGHVTFVSYEKVQPQQFQAKDIEVFKLLIK